MRNRLIARVSKARTLLLIAGAICFVIAGYALAADAAGIAASTWAPMSNPTVVAVFGWLTILFFGGCAVIGARQLFRSEPVMEVDARGIRWRRWSDQVIPWSAIERAEPRAFLGQRFMCLWLDAPHDYAGRSTLGRAAAANRALGFGDVQLTMQGTDQSFDRLAKVVDAHLAARDRSGSGRS